MKNMKLLWKPQKPFKNHETILKSYGNQPNAMTDYKNTILEIQDGLLVHGLLETDVSKCDFPNYVSFP